MICIGKIYKATPSPRTPPAWVTLFLALGLAGQLFWGSLRPSPSAKAEELSPPPSQGLLQLAALGDHVVFARILMLWLQNVDNQPGLSIPFRHLDYDKMAQWLEVVLAMDPKSDYPLFAALHVYAGIPDPQRTRIMLDFIHRQFPLHPEQRWRWLALAAVSARHRLNDPQLALRYLDELLPQVQQGRLPQWVLGIRLSLLQATGQLESARQLIGGLLYHQEIRSPTEIRYLSDWLEKLAQEE
ncbi:MAG: hypothetical protein HQL78_10770 [Magnetococcales bacterium]|nr:hypothetical protein [Magnetococcales bacterium]